MVTTSTKDLRFFNKETGEEYDPTSLTINDGVIESITLESGDIINRNEIFVVNQLLDIEGVGAIPPGSVVKIRDCKHFNWSKDYLLDFGWHTNSSNQCIYSWYLIELNPGSDKVPHTLYKELIPHLDLVRFDHYTNLD